MLFDVPKVIRAIGYTVYTILCSPIILFYMVVIMPVYIVYLTIVLKPRSGLKEVLCMIYRGIKEGHYNGMHFIKTGEWI